MYINLGTIKLNYISQDLNDFMILAEIPNTKMSYESPCLVRSIDELNIWFGKDFEDYDYLAELINKDTTLYLYRPTIVDKTIDYIDYENWEEKEENILPNVEFLPSTGKDKVKYKIVDEDTYYIWYDNSWTDVRLLPQNMIGLSSISKNNRDTLLITNTDFNNFEYCYPEYREGESSLGIYSHERYKNIDDNIVFDYNSNKTLAYKIIGNKFSSGYLIINNLNLETLNRVVMYSPSIYTLDSTARKIKDLVMDSKVYKELPVITEENINDYLQRIIYLDDISDSGFYVLVKPDNTNEFKWVNKDLVLSDSDFDIIYGLGNTLSDIKNMYKRCGFNLLNDENIVYSNNPIDISHKYTYKNLSILPDFRTTQNILTQIALDNNASSVEFWSKTIGRDRDIYDDDSKIKVKIEASGDNGIYMITISRYDYSEVYEGTLFPKEGEDRLDRVISKNSKLVYCNFLGLKNKISQGKYTFEKSSKLYRTDDFEIELKSGVTNISLEIIKEGTEYNHTILISDSNGSLLESWNGDIFTKRVEDQLDSIISAESNYIKSLKFLGREIRATGKEYTLEGAVLENYNEESYWESMRKMFDFNESTVYPDYFLVPEIKYYNDIFGWNQYITNYQKFLDYSKDIGCQFLIQNNRTYEVSDLPKNPVKGAIYKKENKCFVYLDDNWKEMNLDQELVLSGADYIYNYKTDKENRLLYFYKPISVYKKDRPGYYIYLQGLLDNIFSVSRKNVLYESPVLDIYVKEDIEDVLWKYKSNYLVCNNQEYFYKRYMEGDRYLTTGWLRFVIGKINRELQKNKWTFLGNKNPGQIRKELEAMFDHIKWSFSIVDYIRITNFDLDLINNKLNMTLETGVNDLVDSNLSLDITINYKTTD